MPDLIYWTIILTIAAILWVCFLYFILWRQKYDSAMQDLSVWLFFTVLLALAPLVFNAIMAYAADLAPTLSTLLARGELLLVVAAIGSEAAGRLVGSSPRKLPVKILTAGITIFFVIISSLLFSVVATSIDDRFRPERVAGISSLLFLATIIAGSSCIFISQAEANG